MSQPRIVLASQSPNRKLLLEKLRIPFIVSASHINEEPLVNEDPSDHVQRLAQAKANAKCKQFPNHIIIGSDQIAVIDNQITGKPKTHSNAVKLLSKASGKTIPFLNGLCVLNSATKQTTTVIEYFYVTYKTFSKQTIINYLAKEQPFACAGSLKAEGLGIAMLEKIDSSDPSTILGLPLIRLTNILTDFGVKVI